MSEDHELTPESLVKLTEPAPYLAPTPATQPSPFPAQAPNFPPSGFGQAEQAGAGMSPVAPPQVPNPFATGPTAPYQPPVTIAQFQFMRHGVPHAASVTKSNGEISVDIVKWAHGQWVKSSTRLTNGIIAYFIAYDAMMAPVPQPISVTPTLGDQG